MLDLKKLRPDSALIGLLLHQDCNCIKFSMYTFFFLIKFQVFCCGNQFSGADSWWHHFLGEKEWCVSAMALSFSSGWCWWDPEVTVFWISGIGLHRHMHFCNFCHFCGIVLPREEVFACSCWDAVGWSFGEVNKDPREGKWGGYLQPGPCDVKSFILVSWCFKVGCKRCSVFSFLPFEIPGPFHIICAFIKGRSPNFFLSLICIKKFIN